MLIRYIRRWNKEEDSDSSDASAVLRTILYGSSPFGALHSDDGDEKVLMELFEEEVEIFPD